MNTTIKLFVFLAIMVAMASSCSDDDAGQGMEKAKSLVGEWICEMNTDGLGTGGKIGGSYIPTNADQVAIIYHFFDDGTGWKELPVLKDGEVDGILISRYLSNFIYTVDADGKVNITFVNEENEPTDESDELYLDGNVLKGQIGDFKVDLGRATEEQVKKYAKAAEAMHGGSDNSICMMGVKVNVPLYVKENGQLEPTRSIGFTPEQDPKLIHYWKKGEEVQVVQNGIVIGTLKANENLYGSNTMLNGELTTMPDTQKSLEFYLHTAACDWSGQKGNLTDANGAYPIDKHADFAKAVVPAGKFTVNSEKKIVTVDDEISLEPMNAIIYFDFKDSEGGTIKVAKLTISGEDTEGKSAILLTGGIKEKTYGNLVMDTSEHPWQNAYISIATTGSMKLKMIAEDEKGVPYIFSSNNVTFTAGHNYRFTLKMEGPKKLAAATADDKNKLICTEGHIHTYKPADQSSVDALCKAPRVARILYVGNKTDNSTYKHGLALALEDVTDKTLSWSKVGSNNKGKKAAEWCEEWNTTKPVKGASWMLPTKPQLEEMGANDRMFGSQALIDLRDGFSSLGGTNIQQHFYLSNTLYYGNKVYVYDFIAGEWTVFLTYVNDDVYHVRAGLVF